jgi:3',5'-cyclic AMP phosphodiesterase CpdA
MNSPRTLAHLSDLHLGLSPAHEAGARRLCDSLLEREIDHVVVTGDVTHRGKRSQLVQFERIFGPLLSQGRLTLVPGNHDRMGEDAGAGVMRGRRVCVQQPHGLYLVQVDSTAEHNRSLVASHGALCAQVLSQVEEALVAAPPDRLVVLLLHHHVLPLPEESWAERLATLLGWPYASELPLGITLLERVQGKCVLVLHGHRHVPSAFQLGSGTGRPLGLYNAGSSIELAAFRLFQHEGGRPLGSPEWLRVPPILPSRSVTDIAAPRVASATDEVVVGGWWVPD